MDIYRIFYLVFATTSSLKHSECAILSRILDILSGQEYRDIKTQLIYETRSSKPHMPKLHNVEIKDLRKFDDRPQLFIHGFTYVTGWVIRGCQDEDMSGKKLTTTIIAQIISDSISIVKEQTGSKTVAAYDMKVRGPDGPYVTSHIVHSDITQKGAIYFRDKIINKDAPLWSTTDSESNILRTQVEQGEQVTFLNVWRPLKLVEREPLAMCSWLSVSKDDSLASHGTVTTDLEAVHTWKHNENHDWYYLSRQKPQDVWVFMQDGDGINVPHSSFHDPYQSYLATHRSSIEVRLAAIIPKVQ